MNTKHLCAIAVASALALPAHAELIISEYVEGSSNNKAIELVNLGSTEIDLSQYQLHTFFNGNVAASSKIALSGHLAPMQTYVVAHNSAADELKSKAQLLVTSSWFNGDDAIVLFKADEVVDSFGQVGVDPGSAWSNNGVSTVDKTLRRKLNVLTGDKITDDAFDPSLQFEQFAKDDFSDIGLYQGTGTPEPEEPPFVHGQCGDAATLISAVQGTGAASPLVGQTVTVEAVVTASFQGNDGLKGFFIQEQPEDQDQDTNSSEGVFVYDNNSAYVAQVGQVVRVSAVVEEAFGQTQLAKLVDFTDCGTGPAIAATAIDLPMAAADQFEAVEGMKVSLVRNLTVSDNYSLGRYNELTLSSRRLFQPTQVALPGADAQAVKAANALDRITLDDGSNLQNKDSVYPFPGLSALNSLRVGDEVKPFTAVMGYGFSKYRLQPIDEPQFVASNPRTVKPQLADADYRVASFNVLNYFNGDGQGAGFPTSRGADTATEFAKQRSKIISAISALDANVVGLIEIENDGFGADSALVDLVTGLNAYAGADVWAFVDFNADKVGTDLIASAIIYRKDHVTATGNAAFTTQVPFDYGNRPLISQHFTVNQSGDEFNFVVAHLRSKGSCPSNKADLANVDSGDGQGCWNGVRVQAIEVMNDWLASNPTGVNTASTVVVGDFNAYLLEDPIRRMSELGFNQVAQQLKGNEISSYLFGGESGTLDHVFVKGELRQQIKDVGDWAINGDEPVILDYNEEYKSEYAKANFYAPNPYRASDHDPMVLALAISQPQLSDLALNVAEQTQAGTVIGQLNFVSKVAVDHFAVAGEFANWFNVSNDGQITVSDAADLDFEGVNHFQFTVTLHTVTGLSSQTVDLTIDLTDLAELPELTLAGLPTMVDDTIRPGTLLANVTATATGNNANIVSIELVDGDKWVWFKHGKITLKRNINAKHQDDFSFSLKVTDSLGVSNTVEYRVQVQAGKHGKSANWFTSLFN